MDSTAALQTNNIPYLEATPKSRRCFQGISYALGIIALLGIGYIIASRFTFMGTTGTIVGGVTLGLSIPLLILSIKKAARKNEESTANPQVDTTSSLAVPATRPKKKLTLENFYRDNMRGEFIKGLEKALKKLGPSSFKMILFYWTQELKSKIYFQFRDGEFCTFPYQDYPDGSILIITITTDKELEEQVKEHGPQVFSWYYNAQRDSLGPFVEKGHQHIYMTALEAGNLEHHGQFPKRIADILTGKTVLPPLAEIVK